MTQGTGAVALIALVIVAVIAPLFTAQPPTADDYIEKDRSLRLTLSKTKKSVAPKWGFFGTIFNLISQQVNETKSAYNQITDLVSNQFVDDNEVTETPIPTSNGTTPSPKISRSEFLKILDRNLKGLNLLRNKEWRQAQKDTKANLKQYREQIAGAKKT